MNFSLWEKIEAIRQEPEPVRRRYVVLSVSVSMVIIVGIWLLSVSESLSTTAKEIPQAVDEGKKNLGGVPSLNDLFEQAAPLRIKDEGLDGSQYFNERLQERAQGGEEMPQ